MSPNLSPLVLALLLTCGSRPETLPAVWDGSMFAPSSALADDDDDDGGDEDDDDDDYEDDDDDDDDDAPVVRVDDDDDDDDDDDIPPPEFVVAVPDATTLAAIVALGYEVVESERIDLIDADVARLSPPAGVTLAQAQAQIQQAIATATVDLNHIYRPEALTCGPDGCAAFGLVGWPTVPACTLAPTIGMIDTGVNADHPSLEAARVETVSVLGQGRVAGSQMHGTAVALLIAGAPDSRTPGLLPQARLIAAAAFHRDATGADAADVFDIVRALERLLDEPLDVLNLSFSGPANVLLERALAAIEARGIPVVAAVGNAGPLSPPLYPAAYGSAVAVTAIDRENRIYRQANAGEHVDFAAPGVRLWTAASISGGRLRSGTSFAAPFVTAALAIRHVATPDASVAELVEGLAGTALDLGAPGRDSTFGWGLLQMPACGDAVPDARPAAVTQEALPEESPEGPR